MLKKASLRKKRYIFITLQNNISGCVGLFYELIPTGHDINQESKSCLNQGSKKCQVMLVHRTQFIHKLYLFACHKQTDRGI